jgi:excinuclease UvrABC nuclease subunit
VTAPLFALQPLAGDLAAALLSLPAARGVAQLLDARGESLVVGRGASIRSWARGQLGRGRPSPKPGARPRVDLSKLAVSIRFALARSPFHERLLFERLMAPLVPLSRRRDLRPPGWLWLTDERFPRLLAHGAAGGRALGPFRDAKTAARARDALQKRHLLRPCDFDFEPDPGWPTGLRCVYAQVRTCAAPCLAREDAEAYRARAARALRELSDPAEGDDALPAHLGRRDQRAAVVEELAGGALEVHPVDAWQVLEDGAVVGAPGEPLADVLSRVTWPPPASPADDAPWLVAWLAEKKRSGRWLRLPAAPRV